MVLYTYTSLISLTITLKKRDAFGDLIRDIVGVSEQITFTGRGYVEKRFGG